MNGRIPGFKYNPKTHTARFSLYVPNSSGFRRALSVDAPSRDEVLKLWQKFRDEVSGVDPKQPQAAHVPQPGLPAPSISTHGARRRGTSTER